ncbi:UV-endonuclease UvdE-domain-containing protein [Multifurca ochricompacta]|uniref:UV-endonuclease UvdE-domain-containing protein n=1 Tax=Multifurca ochricompacta TaxID=376703 RepID=A0AAD4M779_9AGAM|nr:UV-endonuclease UvdE-domain-containing protein [Multifurca ochricompacta]
MEFEQPDDSSLTDLSQLEQPQSPPKKRRRKTKVVEPIVYDIPPVESKTTAYRGRLGYACLNTILRALKPDPIFCSRTCRIDTILKHGLNFAKGLGIQNVKDLAKLIQWNEDNGIRFMRISSELFPLHRMTSTGTI